MTDTLPIGKPAGGIPLQQHPYEQALLVGFKTLLADPPGEDQMRSLGVTRREGAIRLPVLNGELSIDTSARAIHVMDASDACKGEAKVAWGILAVHYLCAPETPPDTRMVAFSHFEDSRGYLPVFRGRILGRFLATSGRSSAGFVLAAERAGGEPFEGPGTAYRFHVLPRVPLVIIRHEGDNEFGPGATLLYQADAGRMLPAEDRIVAAELLLDALAGKPMIAGGGRESI